MKFKVFFIFCTLVLFGKGSAGQPLVSPPLALEADSRLSEPVTLNLTCIGLESLLSSLSTDTLKLRTESLCAEQKLQISVKARSKRFLMTALAQLLPGYWAVEPEGYRFHFSREKKEARENWWRLFTEERNAAMQAICDEAQKQLESPLEAMRNEDGELESKVSFDEHKTEQDVFSGLPDASKKELFSHLDIRPFYQMPGGAMGMGADEGGLLVSFDTLPPELRQRLIKRFHWETNAPKSIQYSNSGSALFAAFLEGKGRLMRSVSMTFPNKWTLVMRPNHSQLARYTATTKDHFPAGWMQLARAHQVQVWANTHAAVKPNGLMIARSDVQSWLIKHKQIEIISDFYSAPSRRITPQEMAAAPTGTTANELNNLAALHDVSWKQTGGVFLIRDNRWYRNDLLEVPQERLEQIQREANALTISEMVKAVAKTTPADYMREQFDAQAEAVRTLSPWQLFNGLKWDITVAEKIKKSREAEKNRTPMSDRKFLDELPSFITDYHFTSFSDLIMEQYETLRWYAALNKKQQKALWEGTLQFGSLSILQQQSLLNAQPRVKIALGNADKPLLLKIVPKDSETLAASGVCRVKIVAAGYEHQKD